MLNLSVLKIPMALVTRKKEFWVEKSERRLIYRSAQRDW